MTIEILYPEIANLNGDLENPRYLARSCGASLISCTLGSVPAFVNEDVSLVYLGSTTERGQILIRDALSPYADALRKRTERGGITLVTGNALELFGSYIEDDNGIRHEMLEWFPTHARQDLYHRYNAFGLGSFDEMQIVGFLSRFSHSYGKNEHPLFRMVRGAGMNPDESGEGFRMKNFMATYLLGPLMILNPLFAKYTLGLMGVTEPKLAFEEAAVDAYFVRLAEFSDPGRNCLYK